MLFKQASTAQGKEDGILTFGDNNWKRCGFRDGVNIESGLPSPLTFIDAILPEYCFP